VKRERETPEGSVFVFSWLVFSSAFSRFRGLSLNTLVLDLQK
jgi:hypothetical protein